MLAPTSTSIYLLVYFALVLGRLGHLSVLLASDFLLLDVFESGEKLVEVHGVGEVEEGEVLDRGYFCHKSITHLVGFLLYIFLIVFKTNEVGLLNEIGLLIG